MDISVLCISGHKIDEIATVSLDLGGDILNYLLAEWAHMQVLREKNAQGPPFSGMASIYRDKMVVQCEEAKRSFSEGEEDITEISIVRYGQFGPVNIILTYSEFADIMRPKIEEALGAIDEGVTRQARLSFEEIGCLIMVGGSSKLRGLREAMDTQNWSCEISFPEDSDWHVADGAAALASGTGDYVCAQNVALRLCDDTLYPLLSAGQDINHSRDSVVFGLVEDTDSARFVFVENSQQFGNRLVNKDKVLGHLTVPAFGFSNEPIALEFHVDEDLLFHVVAKSEKRGSVHSRTWMYSNLRFSYQLPGEL